jgi:hypothetical protein
MEFRLYLFMEEWHLPRRMCGMEDIAVVIFGKYDIQKG